MKRVRTSDELHNWIDNAEPGERAIYHTGHLAYDRERTVMNKRSLFACNNIGLTAYREYEKGNVELTQARSYVTLTKLPITDYVVTKRKYRRSMPYGV